MTVKKTRGRTARIVFLFIAAAFFATGAYLAFDWNRRGRVNTVLVVRQTRDDGSVGEEAREHPVNVFHTRNCLIIGWLLAVLSAGTLISGTVILVKENERV